MDYTIRLQFIAVKVKHSGTKAYSMLGIALKAYKTSGAISSTGNKSLNNLFIQQKSNSSCSNTWSAQFHTIQNCFGKAYTLKILNSMGIICIICFAICLQVRIQSSILSRRLHLRSLQESCQSTKGLAEFMYQNAHQMENDVSLLLFQQNFQVHKALLLLQSYKNQPRRMLRLPVQLAPHKLFLLQQ